MQKKHLNKYLMDSKDSDVSFSKLNRAKSMNPPDEYDDLKIAAMCEHKVTSSPNASKRKPQRRWRKNQTMTKESFY